MNGKYLNFISILLTKHTSLIRSRETLIYRVGLEIQSKILGQGVVELEEQVHNMLSVAHTMYILDYLLLMLST